MTEAVSAVKDQYTRYPFPGHFSNQLEKINKYPGFMRSFLLERIKKKIAKSKRYARIIRGAFPDGLEGKRILDAGCGTGELATSAACQIPEATFLGLDLSPESVQRANTLREQLGLSNLTFQQANLLELPELEPFDLIMSIGVLHHMPDPQEGLKKLKAKLKPGGQMIVYLYSSLGRFDVVCKRKGLEILIPQADNFEDKLKVVDELNLFPVAKDGWWKRFKSWMRSDVEYSSLDSIKVDQLAHVQETNYTVEEIYELLDACDLELVKFVGTMPDSLAEVTDSPLALERAKGLDKRQEYRLIELLYRPFDYTFVARDKGSET